MSDTALLQCRAMGPLEKGEARKARKAASAQRRRRLRELGHPTKLRLSRERPEAWTPDLKRKLAEQQNWRCCICGWDMHITPDDVRYSQSSTTRLATFQRIRPRSQGGSDDVSNLAISCEPCNQSGVVREQFRM